MLDLTLSGVKGLKHWKNNGIEFDDPVSSPTPRQFTTLSRLHLKQNQTRHLLKPWTKPSAEQILRGVLVLLLLYIQLTISFLIGRKCTVNFWKQRLGRHLVADYITTMSRILNVTGNHVMYDRGAWLLRLIMSSSSTLFCLPSVKKQKHGFQLWFVHRIKRKKIRKASSWKYQLELFNIFRQLTPNFPKISLFIL